MDMDVTQALRDAENSLRDFICFVLSKSGPDWVRNCGVSSARIAKWEERKSIEEKRQEAGVVEERLIYYADFYDIKTILKKNWPGEFSTALGDLKTMDIYLAEIEKLRDSDAHRRELLPHQKHLVLGVSGEIRNKIVRYRSKMETPDDCFPRIESARDSLGNIWVPGGHLSKTVLTGAAIRPGDVLDFVITASDPEDLPLEYRLDSLLEAISPWQADPTLQLTITDRDIKRDFSVTLQIRSTRKYHAHIDHDDWVIFTYDVLPRDRTGTR
jgi:hypothetical protein